MAVAGVVESQECGEGQHRGEGGEVEVVCRLLRYGVSHAVQCGGQGGVAPRYQTRLMRMMYHSLSKKLDHFG